MRVRKRRPRPSVISFMRMRRGIVPTLPCHACHTDTEQARLTWFKGHPYCERCARKGYVHSPPQEDGEE